MLRDHVGSANLNIVGREDYVGAIECSIRTIKERARCICYKFPYKYYTKLVVNAFPNKEGIDKTFKSRCNCFRNSEVRLQ